MFFKKRTDNTGRLDRVAKLYLGYKFFSTLYFTYPIFYEFASQTITPVQVGIFFSVIGICGLLAEIPTGIIADKRGRKLNGLLGVCLLIIAPLIVFFGHTFPAYLVAALFYGIGRAFLSGALESLVYDHKNISKATYRRVNTFEITYAQAGILVSAACGGFLFSLHQSLPFMLKRLPALSASCSWLLYKMVTLVILNLIILKIVKSDTKRILYIAGGATVAYICMSAGILPLFFLGYLLWCCLNATSVFIRVMLHDRIPSSHRSTILSNFKTLAILIGIGGSTATGLLVQGAGTPQVAYVVFSIISCAVLLPCAFWLVTSLQKQNGRNSTQ